jgi:sigma-B regulation protein RsbU (phosphoserine phosphatase)
LTVSSPKEKTLLAKLRHDLRTPINHILGYSELLQEDLADRGVSKLGDLEKIQTAARQLLDIVGTRLSEENFAGPNRPESRTEETADSTRYKKIKDALQFVPPEVAHDRSKMTGRILVVDDQPENREVLVKRLKRQGHQTAQAENGRLALELLSKSPFDLVLLDVMMPDMDGYTALGRMKADPALRHIPVIMISALDEIETVVRCIEAGAEDFLPKPFSPTLLRARIEASLEKKTFRDQEQAYLRQIEETQKRLEGQLQEAARYVVSILPPPMEKPFAISWAYDPSTELGGDSFGYHWIDENHFAIYLLDVCGHGVGAALLSVAAINVIRSASLPQTDFLDPAQVLSSLNDAFQMERHNNMYFTIWYGVYDLAARAIRHASGGHPPALLLRPAQNGADAVELLRCPGMLIGAMPDISYQSETSSIPKNARLFVFCDGAYEIKRPDHTMLDFDDEFVPYLVRNGRSSNISQEVLNWVRSIHGTKTLADDFSFLAIDFSE